jgi:hypothetical protein
MYAAFTMPKTNVKYSFIIFALLDIILTVLSVFITVHHVTPVFAIILLIAVDTTLGFTVQAV